MSTRALIIVKDEETHDLLTVYKHSDGYPTGLGMDLLTFLNSRFLTSGVGEMKNGLTPANGMGDLAAQLLADLKHRHPIGGVYVMSNGTKDVGEEWLYIISGKVEQPLTFMLKVYSYRSNKALKVFYGPISDFNPQEVEAEVYA